MHWIRFQNKMGERTRQIIPAVHDELAEPAETIASGGKIFCRVKTSTRRGANSSFCSRWPSLWSKKIKHFHVYSNKGPKRARKVKVVQRTSINIDLNMQIWNRMYEPPITAKSPPKIWLSKQKKNKLASVHRVKSIQKS